jgi:hypothetical protein
LPNRTDGIRQDEEDIRELTGSKGHLFDKITRTDRRD